MTPLSIGYKTFPLAQWPYRCKTRYKTAKNQAWQIPEKCGIFFSVNKVENNSTACCLQRPKEYSRKT